MQSSPLQLPELNVPLIMQEMNYVMQEMNYGCGTMVHPNELGDRPKILYVGVGDGLEALQFAYFSRHRTPSIWHYQDGGCC